LFCLLPCTLSSGLKAWIATHPPPLHQKPEASARGFFCSPLPILAMITKMGEKTELFVIVLLQIRLVLISEVSRLTSYCRLPKLFSLKLWHSFGYYIMWRWTGTVWKAKNSSSGSTPVEKPVAKAGSDVQAHHVDNRPGRSFRNFRFDTASILPSMEASFLRT
jgi:hypothetical protein